MPINSNTQWYLGHDGQQYGPFPHSEVQAQFKSGRLLPTDWLWCAEINRWAPAGEIFPILSDGKPPPLAPAVAAAPNAEELGRNSATVGRDSGASRQPAHRAHSSERPQSSSAIVDRLGATSPASDNRQSVPATGRSTSFRDPTSLTRWLTVLLLAWISMNVVMLVSNTLQYNLLTELEVGRQASGPSQATAVAANDTRQLYVARLGLATLVLTVIVFCLWTYRANVNARALGAVAMEFTPGWAVGWYFVPIATLFKPYQAMREIWKASKNPAEWYSEPRGWILPLWWFLHIVTSISDQIAFRMMLGARSASELIAATQMDMASDVLNVPAGIVSLVLIRQIYRFQTSGASGVENRRG